MSIEKFINKVKESLGLNEFKKSDKKKSIRNLLKKLYEKKASLSKSLDEKLDKKKRKELQEELDIISIQIKKGNNILHKLESK